MSNRVALLYRTGINPRRTGPVVKVELMRHPDLQREKCIPFRGPYRRHKSLGTRHSSSAAGSRSQNAHPFFGVPIT